MSDVTAARIPAPVLAYDDDLDVTLFCLDQYARHWPDCRLQFLVPVNGDAALARLVAEAPTSLDVRPVRSDPSVGATLRTLLAETEGHDWIFWANGDRYPYAIPDPDALSRLAAAIVTDELDDEIVAVRLTRWKDALEVADAPIREVSGQRFHLRPPMPHGFWHHHLLRRTWLAQHVETGPEHETLYEFHHRVMARLATDPGQTLIPERALMKFEEPILKGFLTLNYGARLKRRGQTAQDRPARRVTTAYVSPRIEKDNFFWEKVESAPSLARNWPSAPVTVISYGGVGSKALARWLLPEAEGADLSRAHSHRRVPPAGVSDGRRLVYVFGDPREAVLSIFNRRDARHERHGFEPTPSREGRQDFAVCHATNLEVDPRPMTPEWGLGDFLAQGMDLFRLEEHFDFWRYADADYPILFLRYESLGRTAGVLAEALGLTLPPFDFKERVSRLEGLQTDIRQGLDVIYGDFAATLAPLPDLFEARGTSVTVLAD